MDLHGEQISAVSDIQGTKLEEMPVRYLFCANANEREIILNKSI